MCVCVERNWAQRQQASHCNTQSLQTDQVSGFWVSGWSWGWAVSAHVGVECESEKEEESGARSHLRQCLHCMTHRGVRPAFTAAGQSSTRSRSHADESRSTKHFWGFTPDDNKLRARRQLQLKTPLSPELAKLKALACPHPGRRSLDLGPGCFLR